MSVVLSIAVVMLHASPEIRGAIVHGGRVWSPDGGVFRPLKEEEFHKLVARLVIANPALLKDGAKTIEPAAWVLEAVRQAVTSQLPDRTDTTWNSYIQDVPPDTIGPFVVVPGGILDLGRAGDSAECITPESSNFLGRCRLPYRPDFANQPVLWLEFLSQVFRGDQHAIDLVQEMFGYCLFERCELEKFFVLFGRGGAGKSTILRILREYIGTENTSTVSISSLGHRFSLSPLEHKLVNINWDATLHCKFDVGVLKSLVSGEPVTVEEKYQPARSAVLTAKHVILTNEIPAFDDQSDGIRRRLIAIPFDFQAEPADTGLFYRLSTELPEITGWAVKGFTRLRREGFTEWDRSRDIGVRIQIDGDPVRTFLAEHCELRPDLRVGRQSFFDAFSRWAERNGFQRMNRTEVYRRVERVIGQTSSEYRTPDGHDRAFVGLRLCSNGLSQPF